jgi:hypothetical protein
MAQTERYCLGQFPPISSNSTLLPFSLVKKQPFPPDIALIPVDKSGFF